MRLHHSPLPGDPRLPRRARRPRGAPQGLGPYGRPARVRDDGQPRRGVRQARRPRERHRHSRSADVIQQVESLLALFICARQRNLNSRIGLANFDRSFVQQGGPQCRFWRKLHQQALRAEGSEQHGRLMLELARFAEHAGEISAMPDGGGDRRSIELLAGDFHLPAWANMSKASHKFGSKAQAVTNEFTNPQMF